LCLWRRKSQKKDHPLNVRAAITGKFREKAAGVSSRKKEKGHNSMHNNLGKLGWREGVIWATRGGGGRGKGR